MKSSAGFFLKCKYNLYLKLKMNNKKVCRIENNIYIHWKQSNWLNKRFSQFFKIKFHKVTSAGWENFECVRACGKILLKFRCSNSFLINSFSSAFVCYILEYRFLLMGNDVTYLPYICQPDLPWQPSQLFLSPLSSWWENASSSFLH